MLKFLKQCLTAVCIGTILLLLTAVAEAGTGTPGLISQRLTRGRMAGPSWTTTEADTIRSVSTSTPVVSVSNAAKGPSYQHVIPMQLLVHPRQLTHRLLPVW
jgi:hypothetical protein